ncbi:MAG: ATP-binding protein [Gammaproteobacteria bacterium]
MMFEEQLTNPLVLLLCVTVLVSLGLCFWLARQLLITKKTITKLLLVNPEDEKKPTGNISELLNLLVLQVRKRIKTAKDLRQDVVTENKAVAYQHKKMQSTLEVFTEGVVILDQTGKATFANQKLNTLLGVTREDVIGKQPDAWCADKKILSMLVRYEGNVARLRRSETVQFSPQGKEDKTLAATVTPISMHSKPELTIGILITFRDVSAESMAKQSRDDFVAHVSHELKSPLNVIKMHSELLLDVGDDAQSRIMSINVINDEVDRVSEMITDLLNITRLEVGNVSINRKRIRFRDFVTEVFEKMQRSGEENNIQFKLDLPRSLSHVSIDKDLFRIALNNILSNAIKYNKPGGLVTIEAEENDESIILRISDTGIGISPEDHKKIFDKFYRSDDDEVTSRNGHGLGLSLAHEIIVLHNGNLSLESVKGKGTTFILELGKTSTLLKEAV